MFIQALAAYADTRLPDQLQDPAFESKPVPFFLEVAPDGTFLGFIERTHSILRGKKQVTVVQQLNIPKSPVSRNTGLHPLLACDDMKYVLGPGAWTAPREIQNHQERHSAFVGLLRNAAATTQDLDLLSAVRFYDSPSQIEAARNELAQRKLRPGSAICLYINGPLTANPAVREYWCAHYNRAFGERSQKGGNGICLISGVFGPIAATHDKIKGLGNLEGQAAGVSLMSFDKAAFRSYGWEQNANSPVSPSRANAYVIALNDLLKAGSRHRRNYGKIGFVFWTKHTTEEEPFSLIETPDPAQINKLLSLDSRADPDPNLFYFLGLSGNGGRLLVRHWYHDSLGTVKAHVRDWFAGLQIINVFTGAIADPPPLWQLLKATARDEPPPSRVLQLLGRAIEGQTLGRSMLASLLTRMRAARKNDRLNAQRAGLIRLCTNDVTRTEGTMPMLEQLDPGQTKPAYLCGRLLAIYDALQYQAQGDLNLTIADRYYSLASTNPTIAFPRIEDLGQKHLRKLRRDKRGAMVAIERQIQEVHQLLAAQEGARFPGQLTLEDQGRFAIGFHHQKAENMSAAVAHKQKNKTAISENEEINQ